MIYLILLFPIIWAWITKMIWPHKICWKELGLQLVIITVVCVGIVAMGRSSAMTDTEVWNDEVVEKTRETVSCEHSYQCNCVTIPTDSKGGSITTCQTCYDHDNDFDWNVYASTGIGVRINRIDERGVKEPPRWTAARIGGPFSSSRTYTNYIRASSGSLFNDSEFSTEEFAGLIPPYPDKIYDYYRKDSVVSMGVPLKDFKEWNSAINDINKKLGPKKKVNLSTIFVKSNNSAYIHALEKEWVGGKKNDVVVVFGVPNYPKIDWVRIMSWDNEHLKANLRANLEKFKELNEDTVQLAPAVMKANIEKHYKKMNMEDYEYLKDNIEPPTWVLILAAIVSIGGSIGLTFFFYKNDVFGTERKTWNKTSGDMKRRW